MPPEAIPDAKLETMAAVKTFTTIATESANPAKAIVSAKKKSDDEYLISGIIDSEQEAIETPSTVFKPLSIQVPSVSKKVPIPSKTKSTEEKSVLNEQHDESEISDEIAFAQAVEEAKPDRYSGILKKGRSRYLSGKWEESLPLLLEYLKHKPDGEVYGMVGNVFSKLGMLDDAFNASMRAYNLGYKDPAHLVRLGTLAESTGKFREGVQILSETLKKAPHRLDLRIKYVKCLIGAGYKEKAKSELKSVLMSPNCSYSLKNLVQSELALLGENTVSEGKK